METLKKLWAPIAGFIGAVTLVVGFIQLWKGDQATVTYVSAGLGALAILGGLVWGGFSKRVEREQIHPGQYEISRDWRYPKLYRWARIGLAVFLSVGLYGVLTLSNHRQGLREKTVPLIAIFDGPEETYGVTNELLEQLADAVANYQDIQVVALGKKITVEQGSTYARSMGNRYLADIVIWGWYRPTDNPNITLHIENLASTEIIGLNSSTNLKPTATLADLSSFSVQQALGQEMSSMVIFISGYGYFRAGHYQEALDRFEKALSNKKWSDDVVNRANILFYISLCHLLLGQYGQGANDIDLLIKIDPTIVQAYHNRGFASMQLGDYAEALDSYSQVIQLNPKNTLGYVNRANLLIQLGDSSEALADLNRVIELDPANAEAYYVRGLFFMQHGDYSEALANYNRAIELNPAHAQAYYARGLTFKRLGDNEKAIKDFQVTLELTTDPELRATTEAMLQSINKPVP